MASTELTVCYLTAEEELKACQNALGDIEICIYEMWEFEAITKDAARRFLRIAEICGWDMEWVAEMREWAE